MPQTAPPSSSYILLNPGDPAPWFHQRNTSNPNYAFSTAAGRYILMAFFVTAGDATGAAALAAVAAHRHLFDDERACFFGVSLAPEDESTGRVSEALPGIRHFWDHDGRIARLYGVLPQETHTAPQAARRFWLLLDPAMRVLKTFPMPADGGNLAQIFAELAALPPPERAYGVEVQAPILFLPNVFEPELCADLIGQYEAMGGEDSGFMRDVDGRTVLINDYAQKRRRDVIIDDQTLIMRIQKRVKGRIHPEIMKVHSFDATRMERYIVGCYTADDGGHFRAHRDNTTRGTAHRRFAVSINLNSDFDGGEISFPEYSPRGYKPPPGGAVVFPCGLLHAVSKVTRGARLAFLPFLYDDAAAKIRAQNSQFLEGDLASYNYTGP